ncbi:MAG: winged helix-turn-helix domain-containing protein, partial [Promethearchaeota archaeon]
MSEPSNKNDYLSSKTIVKGIIVFLLFRSGSLTAKQIQKRIGLKRQTTYNYLKELQEEGRIEAKYERLEDRPNLSVAYYSIKKPPFSENEDKPLTQRHKEGFSVEGIKNALDSNIAALIELRAAFNRMTHDEIDSFVRCAPEVWGYYGFTYLLTDGEYGELQIEFKEMLNRLHKKWSESQDHGKHSGNVFTFTFYKSVADFL